MKQNPKFTEKLQAWMNTPDDQKNWDEGALLLLQLSGNQIMYRNISVNPKGKAEFIKGQLKKYLNFRLQQLTTSQVQEMQSKVDEIVKKVIKPNDQNGKSEEFADFKAGKRSDHDQLPDEIKALYVENLDIVHRMRELHLKLRSLSLENASCPDSERYPFLKEIIALDKKLHANWDTYDHFVIGVSTIPEGAAAPITEGAAEPAPDAVQKTAADAEPAPKVKAKASTKKKVAKKSTQKSSKSTKKVQ